jgi:cytochrome c-type biogenesis protein CcmH
MNFWLLAGALLALVLARLAWIAVRGTRAADVHAAARYYHAQAATLDADSSAGEIAPEQVSAVATELARAALDDVGREPPVAAQPTRVERWLIVLVIAVLTPAIAIPVYLHHGSPRLATMAPADVAHPSPAQMIAELQQRISAAPKDPEPRLWLARVYMATQAYDEAVTTFAELEKLVPEEPAVLVQYADALAMAHQGKLDGLASALIQRALSLDPANITALWLAGLAADQAGQSEAALGYLSRARDAAGKSEVPTDDLDKLIREIESRSGLSAPGTTPAANVSGARLTVHVELADGVARDLPPDTTVFVLAKEPGGPPMPLAVKRVPLGALPADVVLDDSLAMAPQFKLSSAREVVVTARVSRAGQPIAAAGDVQGSSTPIAVGGDIKTSVLINQVVP